MTKFITLTTISDRAVIINTSSISSVQESETHFGEKYTQITLNNKDQFSVKDSLVHIENNVN